MRIQKPDEGVRIDDCRAVRSTDKALLVECNDVWPKGEWIPQSQIHDDSEVWQAGDEGTLVITEWLAQQKGVK